MNIRWINNIILGLIDTYDTNDPYELCKQLHINIIKVDAESPLLFGEPAIYINRSDDEFIYIRNDLPKSYEEFYIKHELGHAILHPGIINSLNRNLLNIDKMEKEANYFAFKLYKIDIDKIQLQQFTLEQIASYLEVPYKPLKQIFAIM